MSSSCDIRPSRDPKPDEALPSYEEASSSNYAAIPPPDAPPRSIAPRASGNPVSKERSPIRNPQRYSSLLPPSAPSLGPPPNYAAVTSSIPGDCSPRRRARSVSPVSPERSSRPRWRLHSSKPSAPPKQEGVPLEEVVDRFGNRKREIKLSGRLA